MVLLIIFAGTGLLIAGLGVPLWRRMVPPNHIYGLRVPATLSSPEVWYEANSRSGLYSVLAGTLIVVVAGTVFAFGLSETQSAWINVASLLVAVLFVCMRSVRLASAIAHEATKSEDDV